jgi:hypothetical protein
MASKALKTFRMKKEMLENWLKALRSGKYKQCSNYLENQGGYCCLGVLQVITDGDVERFNNSPRALPRDEWFLKNGITNLVGNRSNNILTNIEDAREGRAADYKSASALNDNDKLSFSEIADVMEASCETY